MMIDISRFNRCNILVVGDLMIDEYLWGTAEKISPEAPVPVVSVHREALTLGGAGNVVNNLVALGARVSTVGVIGTGRSGRQLLDVCRNLGLDTSGIFQVPERPTTRKSRVIAGSQHVLRIDWETRQEIPLSAMESVMQFLEDNIPHTDVVLVSDYGKGLVTRALIDRLRTAARRCGKAILADPKGLDFSKYAGVSLLTPNRREAVLASGMEITDGEALTAAGRKILATAGIDSLLITCGPEGMVLFQSGSEPLRIRSLARQVFDVSGAGDTVLAVLGLCLAAGAPMETAAAAANTAAGIVVGKVGTATVSQPELAAALEKQSGQGPAKEKTISELTDITRKLHKSGRKIVLTNGCFDLLHAGHVEMLAASRRQGDVLVVALDDDRSVRKLKGPGRPVIGQQERIRILDALDAVDYVVVFSSEALEDLIGALRPDVLTKGGNYPIEAVRGRDLVEQLGGRVVRIPTAGDVSSTKIIDGIRKS